MLTVQVPQTCISRCTRMKQIWSPLCARRCSPCENRVVRDWEDQLRCKRKKAQGTPGITNLSLGDHHGYTVPHYHFKHRPGSTEVDAVAASLEWNDSSAASSRRPIRCRLSPKHRLEADCGA